jgi:tetratricopeptide (TPR) repeat protein
MILQSHSIHILLVVLFVSLIIPPTKIYPVLPSYTQDKGRAPFILLLGFIALLIFPIVVPVSADTATEIAITLVRKGDDLMLQEKYHEALGAYEEAVAIDPYNSLSWNKLGLAHMSTGRYEDAVSAFQRATNIDPFYTEAWNNLGDSLAILDRQQEALDAYDHALRVNQNDLYALLHKGTSLQETGDSAGAMAIYEQIIVLADREMRKHPNYAEYDAEMWAIKGDALFHLGRFEEAVIAYDAALQINPKYELALRGKSKAMDAILLSRGNPVTTAVPEFEGNRVAPLPTALCMPWWVVFVSFFMGVLISTAYTLRRKIPEK